MSYTDAYGESAFGEDTDSGTVAVATGAPIRPLRPPGKLAPNGSFAPFPHSNLLGLKVTVTGIGPNENVGIPFAHTVTQIQTATPTGIPSINAFGIPTLSAASAAHILVAGIGPAETIGIPFGHVAVSDAIADSPRIVRDPPGRISPGGAGFVTAPPIQIGPVQTIRPHGIPRTGTYTNQSGDAYVDQDGNEYTDQHPQFGTPVLSRQLGIHPVGISSSNVFGSPAVTSKAIIHPTGIASTNAFGVVSMSAAGSTVTIHPVGIASTNRFGVPGNKTISPAGIASTNQFGVPRVARAAKWNVQEPYSHWEIGFPRGRWTCGDPRSAP